MSLDEARNNFSIDAGGTIATYNYMLVGDNAYGYSFSYTNLLSNVIGDLDTYSINVDIGSNYSVIASGSYATLFGTPVNSANFGILDRYGNVLALSTDYGSYSGFTFTALDSIYYIQEYSSSPGFYGMRLENNSIVEQNGIGEQIYYGQTYSAALDYTSDVDIYTASLQAGNTYYFSIQSNIPDIYLDVEYDQQAVASLVTAGSGLYYFTAGLSGNYELHISSNNFVNKGAYTLITQPDITAPSVTNFSPNDGATAVAAATNIDLTFSEAILRGTGTIAIHSGSAAGSIVESFDVATSNLLSISGNTLTINPSANLGNNTQFFVTLDAGTVKDLAGNSYAGTSTYDFTTVQIPTLTPDTIAPTVASFNPTDGATAVAIASNIDLTFSEAIQKGTGAIAIHSGSAAGSIVESFDVATSNLLSISGNTLTINPSANLGNNTQFFVTFDAGTVKDMAGNNYAGTSTYDFITAVATNVTNGTVGNDKLVGTNTSDILNGGKGADSMKGGLGSDTYYVDNAGDKVIESKSAGTDTIYSSISFILGSNVENLILTGKAAINGTGNALNNTLLGNSAVNKLSGLAGNDILNGGLGKDILTGGNGKDIFQLTTLSKDTITDFSVKDDTLQLENSVFGKLIKTGVLSAANFKVGPATDNNDYVLYNSNTGVVSYDANGNGAGGATQITVLGAHLALTHLDFFVI